MRKRIARTTPTLLVATCIALGTQPTIAQKSSAPEMNPSSAKPVPKTRPITFEVISIRRNKTGIMGGSGPTADGYDAKSMFPVILLSIAYGIPDFQRMVGLPEWCGFGREGYDIHAKVSDSDIAEWQKSANPDFRGALEALLRDRFQLKAHFETRDAPAYAMVVSKNGPKFKRATPGDTYPTGEHDRDGKPLLGFKDRLDNGSRDRRLIAQAVPMSTFAQYLSGFLGPTVGRPVVDKTGLMEKYDFSMPILAEWGTNKPQDDSEISIFTVLQDSLGLRLEPAKIPVQFLVIDHIERPSEN